MSAAVDEPLYKRAVSNLLGNAIRFAEPGSQIVIRVVPEGEAAEQVEVTVCNAGPPIAPQHLARLFDRFFRIDSARSGRPVAPWPGAGDRRGDRAHARWPHRGRVRGRHDARRFHPRGALSRRRRQP